LDLPGHGFEVKLPNYTFQRFVDHVFAHIKQTERYNIVVGISFGSTILAAVMPLLEVATYPGRVILGDPVFDMDCSPYPHSRRQGMTRDANPFPREADLISLPGWTREDAILKRWSIARTDPAAVYGLFDVS